MKQRLTTLKTDCRMLRTGATFVMTILAVAWAILAVTLVTNQFVPAGEFEVYETGSSLNITHGDGGGLFVGVPLDVVPNARDWIDGTNAKAAETVMLCVALFALLFPIAQLELLRRILGTVRDEGTPFVLPNAKRLWMLGVLWILAAAVPDALTGLALALFAFHRMPGVSFGGDFFGSLLIGAAIIVLSKVFEYGVVLQQDHDETV